LVFLLKMQLIFIFYLHPTNFSSSNDVFSIVAILMISILIFYLLNIYFLILFII